MYTAVHDDVQENSALSVALKSKVCALSAELHTTVGTPPAISY